MTSAGLGPGVRSKFYRACVSTTEVVRSPSLTISALGVQVGVRPETVRYYERIGLLSPPNAPAVTTDATAPAGGLRQGRGLRAVVHDATVNVTYGMC